MGPQRFVGLGADFWALGHGFDIVSTFFEIKEMREAMETGSRLLFAWKLSQVVFHNLSQW